MTTYQYITLREKPDLKISAAEWFHSKWRVPTEAYLQNETEYGCGWYENKRCFSNLSCYWPYWFIWLIEVYATQSLHLETANW